MEKKSKKYNNVKKDKSSEKRSVLGRLCKLFFYLAGGIVLLFFLLIISIRVISSLDQVKSIAEKNLSAILHQKVTIRGIDFRPLKGLIITEIESPLIAVKKISLAYDLYKLLDGELVITELLIDTPRLSLKSKNGVWNFQPIMGKKRPDKKETPEKKEPHTETAGGINITLPVIPLAVDLEKFLISNIALSLEQDDAAYAYIQGINLEIKVRIDRSSNHLMLRLYSLKGSGRNIGFSSSAPSLPAVETDLVMDVTLEGADLDIFSFTGSAALDKLSVKLADKSHEVAVRADFNVEARLKDERITIKNISAGIGEKNKVTLTGSISNFLHSPVYTVSMNDSSLSLEELFLLARPYLPDFKKSRVAGTITVPSLTVAGTINDVQKRERVNIKGLIKVEGLNFSLPQFNVELGGLDVSAEIKQAAFERRRPLRLESVVNTQIKRLNYNNLFVKDFKNTLIISSSGPDLSVNTLAIVLDSVVGAANPGAKDFIAKIGLDGNIKADVNKGDVQVTKLTLTAAVPVKKGYKNILRFYMSGKIKKWGEEEFSIKTDVKDVRLKPIIKALPAGIVNEINNFGLKGTAAFALNASGRLPTDNEIKNMNPPVVCDLQAAIKNLSFSLDSQGIAVDGFSASVKAGYSDNAVKVSGDISVKDLKKKGGIPVDAQDTLFSFAYKLEDMNTLHIEKHMFTSPSLGVMQNISGKVSGLGLFIKGAGDALVYDIARNVMVDIKTVSGVDLSHAAVFVNNLTADGGVSSDVRVRMLPDRSVSVEGGVRFNRLNINYDEAILTGLNGYFPFKKTIALSNAALPDKDTKKMTITKSGMFTNLRAYTENVDILTIKDISHNRFGLKNADFDMYFKENVFSADTFIFDIFGGSVGGNLFLKSEEDRQVFSIGLEFADINLNTLLKDAATIPHGQAGIDGNMNVSIDLIFEKDGIDLDHLAFSLNITRIGDYAFDRLLLFLDPEESKPAITSARAALKYASPYRVAVTIKNGNLSVKLKMKSRFLAGKIINIPALERIPFASLTNLNTVQEILDGLSGIKEILKYVAVKRIFVDEKGNITF